MVRSISITLALLFALIFTAFPMSSVEAQGTFIWGADVPSNGGPVSSPVLEAGRQYRIVAREIFWYNYPADLAADAQYYTEGPNNHWNWLNHYPAPGGASFLQINGMNVSWGPFSNGDTGHTYSIYYTGKGASITFRIVDWMDKIYGNNACHLPVEIYLLPRSPRTIGYWKTHPQAWPTDSITIDGSTFSKADALAILRNANSKDATYMLAAQLIAAELNVLNGADASPLILQTIDQAAAFLIAHPLGTDPRGADRVYALMLKDTLDYFNNG